MPNFNEAPPKIPLPMRPAQRIDVAITDVMENVAEILEELGYPQAEVRIAVLTKFYRVEIAALSTAQPCQKITRLIDRHMNRLFAGDPIACVVEEMCVELKQGNTEASGQGDCARPD